MWVFESLDRLLAWANIALPVMADLMLYSTIIGGVGLLGSFLLRRKGAAHQSFFLRLSLLATLLTPLAASVMSAYGVKGIHLPLVRVDRQYIVRESLVYPKQIIPVEKEHAVVNAPSVKPDRSPKNGPEKDISPVHHAPLTGVAISPSPHEGIPPAAPGQPGSSHSITRDTRQKDSHMGLLPSLLPWGYLLFALAWFILSALFLLRSLYHNVSIQYLLFTARPAHSAHVTACEALSKRFGLRMPRILQSPRVQRAFLAGLFRPAIVLPLDGNVAAMSSREVFLHEFAHLDRHDHLWNLICQIGKAILPLQPLMWLLARQIEVTGEYACDDYVVAHGGNNRGYARQLYDMAAKLHDDRGEIHAEVGIFSVRSYLFQRIDRILDPSHTRRLKMKMHEILSYVVFFLSSMALSGFFSFRAEAFKRRAMNGEIRVEENKTALTVVAKTGQRQQTSIESSDGEGKAADTGSSSSAEQEKTVSPPENGIPLEETVVAPELKGDSAPAAPGSYLLASLPNQPGSGVELINATETEGRILSLASASDLSSTAAPLTGIPDSTDEISVKKPGDMTMDISARDSLLFADRLELREGAASRGEPVKSPTGQLKIAIPKGVEGILLESLEQGQENPVWSPTGNMIAFTGANGLGVWAVSAKGGEPLLVLDNSYLAASVSVQSRYLKMLGFTPDGQEITFVNYASGKQEAERYTVEKAAGAGIVRPISSISCINIRTGKIRTLINEASDGCWSHDGKYFTYVNQSLYGITIRNMATGSLREISKTGFSPCVTPDDKYLIYVDRSGYSGDQLFRVALNGGVPEQLTNDGFWWDPECSPDGEWILCSGMGGLLRGPNTRLRAYNMRTREISDIFFDEKASLTIGGWSPSGSQYCFTQNTGTVKNGFNIRKSTIHIADFRLKNLAPQSPAVESQPLELKLIGNYPNPFNLSTTIRFSLSRTGITELFIFNMAGQKIRELVSQRMDAGEHSVPWDGRDQRGNPVSSGVYISRLKMEGKVETHRMTLVK